MSVKRDTVGNSTVGSPVKIAVKWLALERSGGEEPGYQGKSH
jgi:hypothetical protein